MNKTTTITILVAIILVAVGIYFLTKSPSEIVVDNTTELTSKNNTEGQAIPTVDTTKTIIGSSVEKRDIVAHHYGTGTKEILFVGGIHGGYEWNTVLVAYELMDYLSANPKVIPEDLKVTVVPVLNPDGLNKVVGTTGRFTKENVSKVDSTVISGRFNANNVDLNRNFDCEWKAKGKWMERAVSGGTSAFSEPESLAMKSYVDSHNPTAVVVWYSSAGGVYSSSCGGAVSLETKLLTNAFANASKYKAYDSFDYYETTGDMVNWFAKNNIPAISVLLTNHSDTEWLKNKAGVEAVLKLYSSK